MTTGLIDVHAHFVTDSYVQQASAAGHDQPDGMASWPAWSPQAHLALMDRHGIATSLLSLSSPGVYFGDAAAARRLARDVNEYAAGLTQDHPGRFGSFAALPLPDVGGTLDEIAYAFDHLGADGVALMTNADGMYLGDQRLEPVFAELSRRQAVVFLHPTSPPGWEQTALGRPRAMLEYIFDTTRTVADLLMAGVLARHPGIQVIVPHGGGALPVLADRIDEFRKLFLPTHPSAAADTVEQLRRCYYDLAGTAFPRQIPALLGLADPDRLLFGSDYCWTPPQVTDAHIAAIDAAEPPVGSSWRSLTTVNAQRLFPRLTQPAKLPD